MSLIDDARRLITTDTSMAVSGPEWRRIVAALLSALDAAEARGKKDRAAAHILAAAFNAARDRADRAEAAAVDQGEHTTGKTCPKCHNETIEHGYGLCGGGIGPYSYCTTEGCNYFNKVQDPEIGDHDLRGGDHEEGG